MKKVLSAAKTYLIITAGAFIGALGIALFLSPQKVTAGGSSGIAIIVNALTGFPIGITMLLINIPLFLAGLMLMGGGFSVRSLYGMVAFSMLTDILTAFPAPTQNPLLGTLAGGALLGIGLGTVFLSGASTGGTDIVACLANKLVRAINIGQWMFIIDFIIIAASGIIFRNFDLCLYGLIALFLNTYLIDFIIQGANTAKMVYIISPKYKEIADSILSGMERGVTGFSARGMYTADDKTVLMCVIKSFEVRKLEQIVEKHDPDAFLIFSQVRQVAGEGFKIYPVK